MRFRKDVLMFALVVCAGVVFGGAKVPPGLWMYTDEFGTPLYSGAELVDTASIAPPFLLPVDVEGDVKLSDDAYDTTETVMNHFKWHYQFAKGFAECKLMWEDRDWPWDVRGYDSLVIKYIGPLSNHKVDIYFGEAIDRYSPAFLESIGSLQANYASVYSAAAWKTVSLPVPPASQGSNRQYLREVRFFIHNAPGITDTHSVRGYFYLDKVGVTRAGGSAVLQGSNPRSPETRLTFVPAASGQVMLIMYSLDGKKLFQKSLSVVSGQRYNVRRFSRDNARLSTSQCSIVRISGNGVNVREKIW